MKYLNVEQIAKKMHISERSVRNYCAQGRFVGAFLDGKTWCIPEDVEFPIRKKRIRTGKENILQILQKEMDVSLHGGLYHKIQIDFTYNSNHMEGSRLTEEETRYIFETQTIGNLRDDTSVDDIVETANHFRCIDLVIRSAKAALTESYIKRLHFQLKNGTSDSRKGWFAVGEYKKKINSVGEMDTTLPQNVQKEIRQLLSWYKDGTISFEKLIEFHVRFERIHPFQDGNGRVGRLILFKECLKHGITPFIIDERLRFFYYRGLKEWDNETGYLLDTCRTGQDFFLNMLSHFGHKTS